MFETGHVQYPPQDATSTATAPIEPDEFGLELLDCGPAYSYSPAFSGCAGLCGCCQGCQTCLCAISCVGTTES